MEKSDQRFAHVENSQSSGNAVPGNYDDDSLVRGVLTQAMTGCSKSREEIADQMSVLMGRPITASMLNARSASSKEAHFWPLCWTRAFCQVTGDWSLVRIIFQRSGLCVIDSQEALLLELGRQTLAHQQAANRVQELTRRLEGQAL